MSLNLVTLVPNGPFFLIRADTVTNIGTIGVYNNCKKKNLDVYISSDAMSEMQLYLAVQVAYNKNIIDDGSAITEGQVGLENENYNKRLYCRGIG